MVIPVVTCTGRVVWPVSRSIFMVFVKIDFEVCFGFKTFASELPLKRMAVSNFQVWYKTLN